MTDHFSNGARIKNLDGLTLKYSFGQKTGEAFNVTPEIVEFINTEPFVDLTNRTDLEPVFVTANSETHFKESLDLIGSVQKFFPSSRILYFDWGLTENQTKALKQMCQVEVRHFNISLFAEIAEFNVSRIRYQLLKPLAIAAALKENPEVVYMDASMRMKTSDLKRTEQLAKRNGGIAILTSTDDSVYAMTHKGMYKYLPSDEEQLMKVSMLQSGGVLLYNTEFVFRNIVWWWCMCDIHVDCSASVRTLAISKEHDQRKKYRGHRFDQSSLNVLLANTFNFNQAMYQNKANIVFVRRYLKYNMYKIKQCPYQSNSIRIEE